MQETDWKLVYLILTGSVLMFGGAAALALAWAFRAGQFENFHRGAMSIFDPDEPVGEATDRTLDPSRVKRRDRNDDIDLPSWQSDGGPTSRL